MDNFTGLGVFVDTYPNEEKHLEVRSNQTAYFSCKAKELTTYYQISEGRSKPCEKLYCNILKKVCLVFFRATVLQQAQKKRYTPRTQVTYLWSLRPKPH